MVRYFIFIYRYIKFGGYFNTVNTDNTDNTVNTDF